MPCDHLVIAQEALEFGWWEAIVPAREQISLLIT
jgi:hypothetical protein